ncbi:MAG: nuclear transport factor 2 family protein [Acidimicrobiia bacterium]
MTAWIDELISAFNAHDATRVGEFMTADAEYVYWRDEAWVTLRGREAIVALLDNFVREWSSDFMLTKVFAVVADDGFAVEYIESGTQNRGSTPSERSFMLRNVMVGELRAGKICRMTDYSEVTAYREQMRPA